MATLKVKKAKLKGASLEVEMQEEVLVNGGGTVTNDITKKCNTLVHEDLKKAFAKLKLHLVAICDLRKIEIIKAAYEFDQIDLEQFKDYEVTGFSIGGDDDNEGVVLIGSRKFDSGKVLNIVTPFTKYVDEKDEYGYANELSLDIASAVYEVEEYLFNNKYAVKQLEMEFVEDEEASEEKELAA
jgi:hypothetical protein